MLVLFFTGYGDPFATKAVQVNERFECNRCGRFYKFRGNLRKHQRYECGKEPQFACHLCSYKAKHRGTLKTHIGFKHCVPDLSYTNNRNNLIMNTKYR